MSSPPRAETLAIKWIIAWILQDQQSFAQSQQNTDDTALIELKRTALALLPTLLFFFRSSILARLNPPVSSVLQRTEGLLEPCNRW